MYGLPAIISPTILETRPMCILKMGLHSKGYAADPLAPRRKFAPLRLRTLQSPRESRRRQGAISDAEIPRVAVCRCARTS